MRKYECVKHEETIARRYREMGIPESKADKVRGTILGYMVHLERSQLPCAECLLVRVQFDPEKYQKERLSSLPDFRNDSFKRELAEAAALSICANIKLFLNEKEEPLLRGVEEKAQNVNNRQRAVSRKRRLKRKELLGKIPQEEYTLEEIQDRDGDTCYLCNTELVDGHISVDHVIPVSAPDCPGDILSNVRLVHDICNSKKHTKRVESLALPFEPPIYLSQ